MYTETITWHELKIRDLTDEEKAEYEEYCEIYGMPEYIIEGELPNDGQEILIVTRWGVTTDTCIVDEEDGYALEDRGDWEGVIAWAEFPRYKMEEE